MVDQIQLDKKARLLMAMAATLILCAATTWAQPPGASEGPFYPDWGSLKQYTTPQWLRDGKFGIYTHWGIYSVAAHGGNGTWFANAVYTKENSEERKYFDKTYGPLAEGFGWKDLIPKFTAEKFNADEWADLFQKAGAKFAGPVAEHHDGFAMWNTKYSEYNAYNMGPRRDVVGELATAIKKRNMKFVTAFHHAENWFYFPTWDKRYDCSNPQYSGLYGPVHARGAMPSKDFCDRWLGKVTEVIDKYDPDYIWYDFGLHIIPESYIKEMMAYYYNKAAREHKEVLVTYKGHDLPPGVGMRDLELGQERDLTYYEWITDSTVDTQGAWGYVVGEHFKTPESIVDNLADRVSKNGYLLLNVGPKPDGTIPEEARDLLLKVGHWLSINGEAIYETTPWTIYGEGPTHLSKDGMFNEEELKYTAKDIRFTVKGDVIYAICLDWPGTEATIQSLKGDGGDHFNGFYPGEIQSVTMLGDGKELSWTLTPKGLNIKTPEKKPCDYAYVFKIVRKPSPFGK